MERSFERRRKGKGSAVSTGRVPNDEAAAKQKQLRRRRGGRSPFTNSRECRKTWLEDISGERRMEAFATRTPTSGDFASVTRNKKRLNFQNFHEWKRKIPFFILFVSILQVVVFYGADDELRRVLPYRAEHKKEIWRFLTYMLLHTNAVHMGLNVTIQGLLGTPLELEQGRLRSAAIYLGGGLAGSLGAWAFATLSSMVGASAGVYALLTSQIPNVVLNHDTIKFAAYRIATVAALTTSDVIYVVCHVYFFNNESPRIGWVAHASGAAAGDRTTTWTRFFNAATPNRLLVDSDRFLWSIFQVVIGKPSKKSPDLYPD